MKKREAQISTCGNNLVQSTSQVLVSPSYCTTSRGTKYQVVPLFGDAKFDHLVKMIHQISPLFLLLNGLVIDK